MLNLKKSDVAMAWSGRRWLTVVIKPVMTDNGNTFAGANVTFCKPLFEMPAPSPAPSLQDLCKVTP